MPRLRILCNDPSPMIAGEPCVRDIGHAGDHVRVFEDGSAWSWATGSSVHSHATGLYRLDGELVRSPYLTGEGVNLPAIPVSTRCGSCGMAFGRHNTLDCMDERGRVNGFNISIFADGVSAAGSRGTRPLPEYHALMTELSRWRVANGRADPFGPGEPYRASISPRDANVPGNPDRIVIVNGVSGRTGTPCSFCDSPEHEFEQCTLAPHEPCECSANCTCDLGDCTCATATYDDEPYEADDREPENEPCSWCTCVDCVAADAYTGPVA